MEGDAGGVPVVAAWFGSCTGDGTRVTGLAVLRPRQRPGTRDASAAASAMQLDGDASDAGGGSAAALGHSSSGAAGAAGGAGQLVASSSKRDPRNRELRLYQFIDTDRWANLEVALVQNAPSHVYLADACVPEAEMKKVEAVIGGADITFERSGRAAFTDGEAIANLTKLSGDTLLALDQVSDSQSCIHV